MKNKAYLQILTILIFSSFLFPKYDCINNHKKLIGKWEFSEVKIDKVDRKNFDFPESYLREMKDKSLFGCSLNSVTTLGFDADSTMTVFCSDTVLTKYHYKLNNKELVLYKSDYVISIPIKVDDSDLTFIELEHGYRKKSYFTKK